METLKSKLESDLLGAMRSSNDIQRRTLRMVIAAIKLAQVDKGGPLDDNSILAIIQKEIKSRHESIEDAQKANRPDLVQAYEAEISVLESYLPKQLTPDELTLIAQSVITETDASSPADMGKVMKVLLPRVQGQAPGNLVSQIVRQLLQKP
jgi:uncharacterized protein YqeY